MNIDLETAVTSNEETSLESEQSADVQAQDTEPNALEEFMADAETDGEDVPEGDSKAVKDSEQTHDSETEEVPSGIRGRILKAEKKADKAGYDRGYAEAQKAWAAEKAEYDAKLAKLAEKEFEEEVVKLAREEHISQNIARRLLAAEKGYAPQNAVQEKATPSMTGQPTLSEDRRKQLNTQAAQIKQKFGMNVFDFVTDDDASAIFKGDMDLWEVAMRSSRQSAEAPVKQSAPPPVKAGNGSSARSGRFDFDTMSDEDWKRFNEKIDRGGVYRPR